MLQQQFFEGTSQLRGPSRATWDYGAPKEQRSGCRWGSCYQGRIACRSGCIRDDVSLLNANCVLVDRDLDRTQQSLVTLVGKSDARPRSHASSLSETHQAKQAPQSYF